MRARHRLSKLLLRQGIVWDRSAWTGEHTDWLRRQRFHRRGVQLAFDEALDAVFSVHARRDRLDTAITEMGSQRWPRRCRWPGRSGGCAACAGSPP